MDNSKMIYFAPTKSEDGSSLTKKFKPNKIGTRGRHKRYRVPNKVGYGTKSKMWDLN